MVAGDVVVRAVLATLASRVLGYTSHHLLNVQSSPAERSVVTRWMFSRHPLNIQSSPAECSVVTCWMFSRHPLNVQSSPAERSVISPGNSSLIVNWVIPAKPNINKSKSIPVCCHGNFTCVYQHGNWFSPYLPNFVIPAKYRNYKKHSNTLPSFSRPQTLFTYQ